MVWPTVKEVQEYRKKVYKIASDVIANHPDLEDSNGTTPVKITWDHPLWSIFTGADQPVDAILYVKLHQSRRNESGIQGDVSPHEHVLFETSCCCSGSGMLVGFSGFVGIVGFRTWSEDAGLQMQVRGACHAMQQRMDTWANCQEGWCATGAGSNQFVYFFDKVFWHFVAFHSRLVPVLALVGLHQILLVLLDCLLPLLVTADPVEDANGIFDWVSCLRWDSSCHPASPAEQPCLYCRRLQHLGKPGVLRAACALGPAWLRQQPATAALSAGTPRTTPAQASAGLRAAIISLATRVQRAISDE